MFEQIVAVEVLLSEFARARGIGLRPPIPIEDIVEKHLKLRVEFDNLHALLGVPRQGLGIDPDIFDAIWFESGTIVIDESLDPEAHPEYEGRYRFTVAHEGGGDCRIHRPLVCATARRPAKSRFWAFFAAHRPQRRSLIGMRIEGRGSAHDILVVRTAASPDDRGAVAGPKAAVAGPAAMLFPTPGGVQLLARILSRAERASDGANKRPIRTRTGPSRGASRNSNGSLSMGADMIF
jgi:hypothetical protein